MPNSAAPSQQDLLVGRLLRLWYIRRRQANWVRVLTHVTFWTITYAVYVTDQSVFSKTELSFTLLLSGLISLSGVIISFYLIGYVAVPRYLFSERWGAFFAILVLAFSYWILANYSQNLFLYQHTNELKGEGLRLYIKQVIHNGLLSQVSSFYSLYSNFLSLGFYLFGPLLLKTISILVEAFARMAWLQKEKMRLELDFLRSQINPHFMFNSLNNLYSLIVQEDDRSGAFVLKLAELMRYVLYESNVDQIDLAKELAFVRNYFDLEEIRLRPDDRIAFDIDGHPETLRIAPLIVVSFVENAFKHGVHNLIGPAFVRLSVRVRAGELTMELVNSKKATTPADIPRSHSGIGIENTRKRLELLYPGRHAIRIEDRGSEFYVYLVLNLYEAAPQLPDRGRRDSGAATAGNVSQTHPLPEFSR